LGNGRVEPLPDDGRLVEFVPVLRAHSSGTPRGTVQIRTTLRNDGPAPADIRFRWSDLVAECDGGIGAENWRVPGRLTLPPGAVADVVIHLRVPTEARHGLCHSILGSTDRDRPAAWLIFHVSSQDNHPQARLPGDVGWGRD